jgi:MFS family permease
MGVRHALIDVGPLRTSRAYRRLWIGQTFSGFGGQLAFVAVMFQVWQLTESPVWTGAVGLAHAAPLLAFGLFAGTLIDRLDRRGFYLVAITGQAVCAVLLAVQGLFGNGSVLLVLGLVALQATFGAGAGPAARTFIPRLLPPEQVAAGLALNRISFQGSMLLGPALGGLVIGWWGVSACYLVDAVTFGCAFIGAFGLPAMRPTGEASRPGLSGIADGLAFLVRNPLVRGALVTDLAATVFSMPISLFPLINAERFGNDPRTLGLFLTAIAVGGVVASAFSGTFTRLPRPGVVMLVGSAGWGVSLALFGLSSQPWLGLAFLALAGAADTMTVVSRSTIIQLNTPDSLQGRVFAAEQIVGVAGPDVGNVRAGLVAGATSGLVSLVSGGLLCLVAVLAVAVTTPGLRTFATAREPARS